jgi:hypothetical protein
MNRAVPAALLFAASIAAAQTTPTPTTQPTAPTIQITEGSSVRSVQLGKFPNTTHITILPMSNCPVGFYASHGVGPNMVAIAAADGPGSQPLTLGFNNPTHSNITQAEVTVHGLTSKILLTPVSTNDDAPTIAKQVELALNLPQSGHASSNLLLQGITSVRSIDLDTLTFADGHTWRAPHPGSCSIKPSNYMAVAAR